MNPVVLVRWCAEYSESFLLRNERSLIGREPERVFLFKVKGEHAEDHGAFLSEGFAGSPG